MGFGMAIKLYAWLVEERPGEWNIIGAEIGGRHFPLVTSREDLVEMMRLVADHHARRTGKRVRFTAFTEDA